MASAYTGVAKINDIEYYIVTKNQTAEVIGSDYEGNIYIPAVVEYEGVTCNVVSIGREAFRNCTNLTSVFISNSVTQIGDYAFAGCTGLQAIVIPNSVNDLGIYAFSECKNLLFVTFSSGLTSIKERSFYGCSSLTSVTIPDNVKSIGELAFSYCNSLNTVILGRGIERLDYYAFSGNSGLTDVYCYAVDVPTTNNAFTNSYLEYATLHVPEESVGQYEKKEPWKNFGNIIGMKGTITPDIPKCAMPTIGYDNNKLTFSCETEDVTFVYDIADYDIRTGNGSEVNLSVTYYISVYASKNGYNNSDVARATLCWINTEPLAVGINGIENRSNTEDGVVSVRALPVLIQSRGGVLIIEGVDKGTPISVYNTAGQLVGKAHAADTTTTVSTTLSHGDVAIVTIGNRSVKLYIQ